MKKEIINCKVIEWKQNNDNLRYPIVTLEINGKNKTAWIPSPAIIYFLGIDNQKWVGKTVPVEARIARKYTRYYFVFKNWRVDECEIGDFKELNEAQQKDGK